MFYFYYSFDKKPSRDLKRASNLEFVSIRDGFLYFDPIKTVNSLQILGVVNRDKSINIKNPLETSFPKDFLCYDSLLSNIRERDDYYKISIILFDIEDETLRLCRDLFGICPLYYVHIPGKLIACSPSLTSLISDPAMADYLEVNPVKIRQYLSWLSDGNIYSSSTFFLNFSNVLPGREIILTQSDKSSKSYLELDCINSKHFTTKEEYGQEFKNLFKKSIQSCLSAKETVGAQLSGGLDSSSICSMIRHIAPNTDIHTLYADTNTELTNEQKYSNLVSKHINSIHHTVIPEENIYESVSLHTGLYGQPEYMHNSPVLNRSIMLKASSTGCNSLFSGHPGDAVVGYGREHIHQLFDEGKWALLDNTISDPIKQMTDFNVDPKIHRFKVINSILSRKKETLNTLEVLKMLYRVSSFFNIPISFFAKNAKRKLIDKLRLPDSIIQLKSSHENPNAVDAEFCSPSHHKNVVSSHFDDVFTLPTILINEEFYILDQYYGINHKFPFYSKALLELCMSVPENIKYDNGRQRGHFREAMNGILPDEVRNRTSKANFGMYGRKIILKLYYESLDLLAQSDSVWDYVNKARFQRSVNLLINDNEELYVYNRVMFFVSKTIYLAIWLDKVKKKSFTTLI